MNKSLLGLLFMATVMNSHAAVEESVYRGMGEASWQFPTLQKMRQQGLISSKADISRYDYTDVYKLQKPLTFMGQTVVLVSDEYMSQYVGCCVSEGWGAVFAKKTDMKRLTQFAQKNQCSLAEMNKDSTTYYGFKLRNLPRAEYYQLSCREHDVESAR